MLNQFTPAHPYADLFPLHNEGTEFFAFSDDIKEHGQHEKIVMFDDKVLDGRRRERACRRAGVEPKYTEFKGTEEQALAFVISKNLHRRHLGEGERALIAGRIITAKKGRPAVYEKTNNSADGAIIEKPLTVGKAAEMLNVSDDDAKKGKKIVEKGTEELQKAVADGTLSVTDAAKVASEPAKVQDAAVKKVRGKKAKTVSAAVNKAKPADEIVDHFKKPVPESLHDVFKQTTEFRSIMHEISALKTRCDELGKTKAGGWIDHQDLARMLEQARAHLRFAMPYTECPKCRRKIQPKCTACKGEGWVQETMFKAASSDDDKAWAKDR